MLRLKWRQIPPLKGDKGDVIKYFTINLTLNLTDNTHFDRCLAR